MKLECLRDFRVHKAQANTSGGLALGNVVDGWGKKRAAAEGGLAPCDSLTI